MDTSDHPGYSLFIGHCRDDNEPVKLGCPSEANLSLRAASGREVRGRYKGKFIQTVSGISDRQYRVDVARQWIAPYAITIFTSATLLFVIQPTIAKQLLPWFGGAAAVWATCLVFFQCLLLLGYLYAHLSIKFLSSRLQVLIHVLLLASSVVAVFASSPSDQHAAAVGSPVYECLKLLARSIGLPYFVLSSTTPLLQAWYTRGANTGLPYRLFALSNLGSLIALLAYPLVMERFLEIESQLAIWRWTYVIFAVVCFSVAIRALRYRAEVASHSSVRHEGEKRDWSRNLIWMSLAACSSALLLGVTNDLCQNIAPIPLLWIIPLAIYLVSFVLCFDYERLFKPAAYQVLLPTALIGLVWAEANAAMTIKLAIPIYLSCLFIICMFCHGQLALLKPPARDLTSFYLCLSLGGALGGVFVGLLAPALFVDFFEAKLAICACLLLSLRFLFGYRSKLFLLTCGLVAIVSLRAFGGLDQGSRTFKQRNFYGVLSVREYTDSAGNKVRTLVHGAVTHGGQLLTGERRLEPTFYYGRKSGVGIALQRSIPAHRVGIIGLGTGTVAAYGKPGDYYRFYELNPLVTLFAYSKFTFLRDSRARVDVAPGDARLSLEHEPNEHFDTLVVDAFSGDSIPVHLLTREAFQCYFRHLNKDGVVAVHVSNQYLDLRPVVSDIAARLGSQALLVPSAAEPKHSVEIADWILVTRDRSFLQEIARTRRGEFISPGPHRLWTDQYSNVLSALR